MRSPAVCLNNTLMENKIKSGLPGEKLSPGYEKNYELDDIAISSQNFQQSKDIGRKERLEKLKAKHQVITVYCSRCGYAHEVILRCKNWRLCEYCRMREAMRLKALYIELVRSIPKERLRLITLTIRNTQKLTKTSIEKIRKYWIKFVRTVPYTNFIIGGFYSIEAVNKGRGWNIHIHILCEVIGSGVLIGSKKGQKHSKDEEKLSQDWLRITGRKAKIVNIRNVWSAPGGLNYILKYLSKAPAVAGESYVYNKVLRNTRLLSSFGSWYSNNDYKPDKQIFVCPKCGSYSWITEFDIRRMERLYNVRSP